MDSIIPTTSAPPPQKVINRIRLRDYPHVEFDGTDIHGFIERYETAGEIEGASSYEKAVQIMPFLRGKELIKSIEHMKGYTTRNWELLRSELLERWDPGLPVLIYTTKDLQSLVARWEKKGGITSLDQFQLFFNSFDTMVQYLVRNQLLRDEDIAVEELFRTLEPGLQYDVKKQLILEGTMKESIDKAWILPGMKILKQAIHQQLKFRSPLPFQENSKRFQEGVSPTEVKTQSEESSAPVPASTPPPLKEDPSEKFAKQMEELTKQFANFTNTITKSLARPPPKTYEGPKPTSSFKSCEYCGKAGHISSKCYSAENDIAKGLVKRNDQGKFMLDGKEVKGQGKPLRELVINRENQVNLGEVNLTTAIGELKWEPPGISHTSYLYEVDIGKRVRKDQEEPPNKEPRPTLETRRRARILNEEDYEEKEEQERKKEKEEKEKKEKEQKEKEERIKEKEIKKLIKERQEKEKEKSKSKEKENEEVILELTEEEKAWIIRARKRRAKQELDGPRLKVEYERPANKHYPDAVDQVINKIFNEVQVPLKVGELIAVSTPVANEVKSWVTRKRVQQESEEGMVIAEGELLVGSSELNQPQANYYHQAQEVGLYSCPLGFITAEVEGENTQCLVDSGSMINILSEEQAANLKLKISEHPATLVGVAGHQTKMVGVAEDVLVRIGKVGYRTHFFIATGNVKAILGRPFLFTTHARIEYIEGKGEMFGVMDHNYRYIFVTICGIKDKGWVTSLPPIYRGMKGIIVKDMDQG